jgi:hypothetical protein
MLLSNCSDRRMPFKLEYDKEGNLVKLTGYKYDEERTSYVVEFDKKGRLKQVGSLVDGCSYGMYDNYTHNLNYQKKQLIYLKNKLYINQYWNFDSKFILCKEISNYYTLEQTPDSIKVNQEFCFEISLDAPMFKGEMRVITGDFDAEFNLKDSLLLDTVMGNNYKAIYKTRFTTGGEKIIRGIIENYKFEYCKQEDLEPEEIERGKRYLRRNYFVKSVYVVE